MSKILSNGHRVYYHKFYLVFKRVDDPGSGFSFDCNEAGQLIDDGGNVVEALSGLAQGSLEYCRAHPAEFFDPIVERSDWSHFEPTRMQCDCGRVLDLYDPLDNECDCGEIYNGMGQRLAPRSQWEEYDDPFEELSDLADNVNY